MTASPSPTGSIQFRKVTFRYGRSPTAVLENFSRSFVRGQFCGITGRSGTGKSTLLYLAGLMLRPQSGSIVVLGEDIGSAPDAVRAKARGSHIGFIFQDAVLEPTMTVIDNILEGVPWGRPQAMYVKRAQQLLVALDLDPLLFHRKAMHLSGGQAQRVAVARALVKEPAIILADEPTGNLDARTSHIVVKALANFVAQRNAIGLFVTHDDSLANLMDSRLDLS